MTALGNSHETKHWGRSESNMPHGRESGRCSQPSSTPAAGSLPQTENALGLPVPGVRRFLIKNQVTETPEQVINIKQL